MLRPLLILFQLLHLSLSQSSIEYTVIPDGVPDKQPCHNCLTLQQFASNVSQHLYENITLIVQSGRHELSVGLIVTNATKFTMYSEPGITLQCNQSGKLVFNSVQHIHIRNINLLDCYGSRVVNVENFTVVNTNFTGSFHVTSGTALEIISSIAVLSKCLITKYYYGTYRWTVSIPYSNTVHRTKKWIGGALIITRSNITIIEDNFTENRAQIGGAIYAENRSIITIINSKFIFNKANSSLYTPDQTAAGGAIYAINNCSLFVYNSSFHNNQVYYGYRLGGSIAVYQGILHIIGSVLSNSRAQVGAAVYLSESMGVFNQSNITGSNAIDDGGALYSVNSSLNFDSTVLVNNWGANGGGISMSKSTMVIQNSTFIHNFANRNGGVIYASMKPVLYIKSSQFKNNSALDGAVMRIDSTQQELQIEKCEFLYNRATADGGVIYVFSLHTNIKINVNIMQSKFISNKAMGNGGVIYHKSYDSQLVIEENDNIYSSNHAGRNGGVMYISGSTLEVSNTYIAYNTVGIQQGIVSLTNCRVTYTAITFYKNLASAIIAIESEINFIGKVNFTENELEYNINAYGEPKGSAVTSKFSILTFSGKGVFSSNKASSFGGAICSINSIVHVLDDMEFLNNRAIKGGGVYLYQSELLCKNQITFLENHANISGGGIYSLNSFIRLSSRGSLLYMRNSAELGGGIFLTRSSKINVQGISGVHTDGNWERTIRLIHNLAVYGGGIYIDDEANPLSCTISESSLARLENECFFQAETFVAETGIKYVFFNLNEASESGSDLYGGLFDRCRSRPGQEHSTAEYLQVFSNIETLSLSVSSRPVRVCFCRNDQPDCDYQPSQRNATKGGEFTLELVAVDQVNNSLAATINALTSSPESRVGLGQQSQQAQNVCTTLTYEVYSNRSSEQLILYANGPCQNANLSSRSVLVHFLPCQCPAGFMVSLKSISICECICHKQLKPYLQGCDSSTLLLVRNSQAWMDVVSRKNLTDGYLVHHHCPYDYCLPPTSLVQINLSVEGGADAQCAFDRSGILCGACKPSFSVALGSSNCLQCSSYWLFLLIPFCLAGIALVVLLLILDINVSKGTLNSIVFYSNIVIANRAILIPIEKYNFLAMFVSWLSLDLGIETCFVDGLDTYIKTWLQFIFPTYILILVFVIIVICQHSQKFSNLLRGRNPVATLATLVWLSNAKYFRTILSVVSFTYLTYPNLTPVILWLPDGNIQYLKGKHIPLFLVSLVILIAAMVYILILLCWQWLLCLPKCKILYWVRNTRLVSLMDAYHAPYKARHRYWPGLLLLVSMVQYFISASNTSGNPAVNLFAVVILTTGLLVYRGIIAGVYKQWPLDVLESTIHFNLILLSSSTLYIMEGSGNQVVLANISLAVIFITFIIIIGYHVLVLLFRDKVPVFLERFSRSWNGRRRDSVSDYLDNFDRDSHHLIKYTTLKENNKSDIVSATKNAEDSTY